MKLPNRRSRTPKWTDAVKLTLSDPERRTAKQAWTLKQ
jgi:hypothetical protein